MKLTPFWNHLWRSARASAAARALRLQRSGCLTPAEPVATCEASNTNGSSSRINRKNMCGRGRQAAAPAYYIDAARKHLHVPTEKGCAWKRQDDWRPTENLAPGHRAVVLVAGSNSNNSPPHLCTKTWGLVPSFDGASQPDYWRMFNARSEGLTTSPVFRRLLKDRRCAVPLDGFFEWTADEMPKLSGASGGGKQPWYVHRKGDGHGEPLWVAGLHESSRDGELETFTLITRDVDPCLAWLHDRMPVILDAAGLHAWLSPTAEGSEPPLAVLAGGRLSSDALAWHPTTKKMSKLDYQETDTAQPAKLPSQQQRSVASFFGQPKPPASAASPAAATSRAADCSPDAVKGPAAPSVPQQQPSAGGEGWDCLACTYRHVAHEAGFLSCAMCGSLRQGAPELHEDGPASAHGRAFASPPQGESSNATRAEASSGEGRVQANLKDGDRVQANLKDGGRVGTQGKRSAQSRTPSQSKSIMQFLQKRDGDGTLDGSEPKKPKSE